MTHRFYFDAARLIKTVLLVRSDLICLHSSYLTNEDHFSQMVLCWQDLFLFYFPDDIYVLWSYFVDIVYFFHFILK